MKPTITVYGENREQIGMTFPRRAKSMVKDARATWVDDSYTAIILRPGNADISLKDESRIKDFYRDADDKVLHASPFEIIKRSKRRTRMLHIAFSVLLWGIALVSFVAISRALGYNRFTFDPRYWGWTWLIFVFAAVVECSAEIFFCRKELAVLDETIDLRQVNPNRDGDLNLHQYKRRLITKIRIMSSAAVWLPLTIFYFLGGYVMELWHVLWVVFIVGVLYEFTNIFTIKRR